MRPIPGPLASSQLVILRIGYFHQQFGCSHVDLIAFGIELVTINDRMATLSHLLDSLSRKTYIKFYF